MSDVEKEYLEQKQEASNEAKHYSKILSQFFQRAIMPESNPHLLIDSFEVAIETAFFDGFFAGKKKVRLSDVKKTIQNKLQVARLALEEIRNTCHCTEKCQCSTLMQKIANAAMIEMGIIADGHEAGNENQS